MNFIWRKYQDTDAKLVDSWLDNKAVNATGLDDGWQVFYDYWTKECPDENATSFCFIIYESNNPFAVMFLAVINGVLLISEIIISPMMRSKGYGTEILKELISKYEDILNIKINSVQAVVFPSNKASIKAFEKVGFNLVSTNDDGDALNYEYIVKLYYK